MTAMISKKEGKFAVLSCYIECTKTDVEDNCVESVNSKKQIVEI